MSDERNKVVFTEAEFFGTDEIYKKIERDARDLPENVKATANDVIVETNKLQKTAGNILQQTEADIEQGLILGTDSKEEIHDKLDDAANKIKERANGYEESVVALLSELILQNKIQGEKIEFLQKEIERANRPLREKIAEAASKAANVIWNTAQNVVSFVKDVGASCKDFALGVVEHAKNTVNSMKDTVDKFLDEKVKTPIKETIQNLRDGVDNFKRGVATMALTCQSKVIDAKDKCLEAITKPLYHYVEMANDKFEQHAHDKAEIEKRLEDLSEK